MRMPQLQIQIEVVILKPELSPIGVLFSPEYAS